MELTHLPPPMESASFPCHVRVGEPDVEIVLWFQDCLIPPKRERDESENVAREVGQEAAEWLKSDTCGRWRLMSCSRREEHPDRVIKTRTLEFEQTRDAEEFRKRFRHVLIRVSITDLVTRVGIQNVTECSLIHEGYYDPSALDLRESVSRFKAFRRDLIGLIDTFERIESLSLQIGRPDPTSLSWMRVICDGEVIPLERRNKADPNDPDSFPILLEKLTHEIATGVFDLSKLEPSEVVPTLRLFCWRVRQVRIAWRVHNEDRVKHGHEPIPGPF